MDFKERYFKEFENLKEDMISSIKELVAIPSVCDETNPNYPFGENIDKALRKVLEICKGLEFKTKYGDNGYYGWAEIGEGEEMLGIVGHIDVVPEGEREAWKFDPYGCVIEDGKMYGRGTQDDKGPMIVCIYSVVALLKAGYKPNKRIRFIFGADEETLWRDMPHYNEKEEIPTYAFSPDSNFPMINAEKGLLQLHLISENSSDIELIAGNAFNAVPDMAQYNGEKLEQVKEELDKLNFKYEIKDGAINVIGKGCHASKPEHGINAIDRLCIALNNVGIKSNAVKFIAEEVGTTFFGEKVFDKKIEDEASGYLSFNVGKVEINKEKEVISVDIRIPVTYSKEDVVEKLKEKAAAYGLTYKEFDFQDKLYIPADHFLIKTLRRVYEEETGFDSTPQSSGGATYSRAIPNCVAFGPNLPLDGKDEYLKVEHEANEYVEIDSLIKSGKIYQSAIYELTK